MENFDEIVKQHEKMIHSIIHSLHIFKNKDEFYQIGLIALWDALQNFNPETGKFSSYAYSYIRGRMLSHLSKETKQNERISYRHELFWEYIEDEHIHHTIDDLMPYCQNLTNQQKKWVIHSFFFNRTQKEIAAFENVSISTVKGWRKASLAKIKASILSEDVVK